MIAKSYFESLGINENSEVVFVSHNDLDGAGPIIVGKKYFKNVRYFNAASGAVDKLVKLVLFAPEYANTEFLFITDCSIADKSLAQTITHFNNTGKTKILLFDHHATATWLNEYSWAEVTQTEGVSGTALYFEYMQELLAKKLGTMDFIYLSRLVRCISDWDTWQWVKNNDMLPKKLSDLFTATGVNYFLHKFEASNDILTPADEALLTDIYNKQKYIILPRILKSARVITLSMDSISKSYLVPVKVKCVQITDAPSDLAEQLYEEGIDIVFMFYHNSISMRTRSEDINLGEFVKTITPDGKAGGHPRSAGCDITPNNFWLLKRYLDALYQIKTEEEKQWNTF